MNDFYGATAQAIQRAVDRWNHLHPGQPLPPSLYRAHLRYNKFKAPPTPGGLAVLSGLQAWYENSLSASWQVGGSRACQMVHIVPVMSQTQFRLWIIKASQMHRQA